jgi:ATP-dependent Zn protease
LKCVILLSNSAFKFNLRRYSKAEKATVSAHEAGHAVVGTAVGCLLPGHPRPEQLSIISRSGGSLGRGLQPFTSELNLSNSRTHS